MTTGSVEPLEKLHARWGDRVQFGDVLIRQAYPGRDAGPYRRFDEKVVDAGRYRRESAIDCLVLVDDLEGTVHQVYGGLADPPYLIDAGVLHHVDARAKPECGDTPCCGKAVAAS